MTCPPGMFSFPELGFGTQQGGSYGALSRLSAGARNQDGAPDLRPAEEGGRALGGGTIWWHSRLS